MQKYSCFGDSKSEHVVSARWTCSAGNNDDEKCSRITHTGRAISIDTKDNGIEELATMTSTTTQ